MQQININNIAYNIPISWSELTYKQGVDVLKHVDDKGMQLSSITGIPMDIVNALADEQVSKLFALISFTENLEVFENDTVLDKYKDFSFGSVSYGTAEKVRKIMNVDAIGQEVIISVIKELTGDDISEQKFLEIIGTANFFLTKSIISTIVSPSLVKLKQVMNSNKQALKDYKSLEALERMLKLQEVDQ